MGRPSIIPAAKTNIGNGSLCPRITLNKFCAKYFSRALLLVLLLAAPAWSAAQDAFGNVAEYQVKAAFLYKFCLYVEWPPSAFASADTPIVLGVAGPENLAADLEAITRGRTIERRSLQVRRIDNKSSLTGVQMLFVARSEQTRLPQFIAQTQKLPVLLVTESPQGLDDGGGINFTVQDERVRFDIGLDVTNRQGLRVSAQLLRVARTVRGEAAP